MDGRFAKAADILCSRGTEHSGALAKSVLPLVSRPSFDICTADHLISVTAVLPPVFNTAPEANCFELSRGGRQSARLASASWVLLACGRFPYRYELSCDGTLL